MKRYCLALDLIDDDGLMADYEKYHQDVWPEIKKSITGIHWFLAPCRISVASFSL